MVFPPPPPDAQRGAEAWLSPILPRLELHGDDAWRIRVLARGMTGVGEAVRWLGPAATVATDVATLEGAPAGSSVLYVFREGDGPALNFARDRLKARGLRVLLWVREELLWVQRATAPDFDHWLLGEVRGPTAPAEALRQLDGHERVAWIRGDPGDLDAALDALDLRRVTQRASGVAFSVLLDAALQPGVKLWYGVDTELDAARVALAMAGAEGPAVWVEPAVEVPVWPVVVGAMEPHAAQQALVRGGLPVGDRAAALLDFEAGAVDLFTRLPVEIRPPLDVGDPVAAVVRAAVAAGLLPAPEARGSWARVTGTRAAPPPSPAMARLWALADRVAAGVDGAAVEEARSLGLLEVAQVWSLRLRPPGAAGGTRRPAGAPAWDVFLAHADGDKAIAQAIRARLVAAPLVSGRRPRVFLDVEEIVPGDCWDVLIPEAQRASTLTVVLLSRHTDQAWYQREEIAAAIELARREGQRVVPVYLDGIEPPYGLRGVHGLHERDPDRIAVALREMMDELEARGELPAPVAPPPRSRARGAGSPGGGEPVDTRAFVGRSAELAALDEAMSAGPGVVVVEGMPGVGKTWLVDEWIRVHPRPTRALILTGGEDERWMIDRLADQGLQAGPEPLPRRLAAALRTAGILVRVENLDSDAQCAALHHLAAVLGGVSILATGRFSGSAAGPGWRKILVEVPPLADAGRMLQARVPGLSADDAERVAAAVHRLPLALDLAAGWLRRGRPVEPFLAALQRRSHALRPAVANHPGRAGRVEAGLAATLALAGAALREDGGPVEFSALGALPLAPAPTPLVAAALGLDLDAAWEAARQVADHGLLLPAGDAWLLHGVVRDWLREEAGAELATASRRVDAWFVAAMEEGDPGTRPRRWAAMAAQPTLVVAWLAGAEAALPPLFPYASFNGPFLAWRDAFARHPGPGSTLAAAELALKGGEADDALRRLSELPAGEDLRVRARAAYIRANICFLRGEYDEALRIRFEEELPALDALRDIRGRAQALGAIADIHQMQGRLDEARRVREEHEIPVYEAIGDPRERAVALSKLAGIHGALRRFDEALRILGEVVPTFEQVGDSRNLAVVRGKVADILVERGRLADAQAILEGEVLPVYERAGDPRSVAVALLQLARIRRQRGEASAAMALLLRAFDSFAALGDVHQGAVTLGEVAQIHRDRGDLDAALRIRSEIQLPAFDAIGARREAVKVRLHIADLHTQLGHHDEALRLLDEEVLPTCRVLGDRLGTLSCRGQMARCLVLRGRPEDRPRIRTLLAQALHAARAMALPDAVQIESLQKELGLPVGETSPD